MQSPLLEWQSLPSLRAIYCITHTPTGRCYIGSAKNLRHRIGVHCRELRGKRHHSPPMARTLAKYGWAGFVVEILECVPESECLVEREQFYIDARKPAFNCAPVAGSCVGVRHTPETRRKRSRASFAVWSARTEEDRKAWGETSREKTLAWWRRATPEQRAACSERGRRSRATQVAAQSLDDRERIRLRVGIGVKKHLSTLSPEQRKAWVAEALAGNKKWRSMNKEAVAVATAKMRATRRAQCAKLDADKVRAIRSTYAAGGRSFQSVADEFGISVGMAHGVVHRTKWGDVE